MGLFLEELHIMLAVDKEAAISATDHSAWSCCEDSGHLHPGRPRWVQRLLLCGTVTNGIGVTWHHLIDQAQLSVEEHLHVFEHGF